MTPESDSFTLVANGECIEEVYEDEILEDASPPTFLVATHVAIHVQDMFALQSHSVELDQGSFDPILRFYFPPDSFSFILVFNLPYFRIVFSNFCR